MGAAPMAAVPVPNIVECSRLPELCRQGGKRPRAYVKVHGKRTYIGSYDDPSVRERYNRFKLMWERTGRLHMELLVDVAPATDGLTITELGEKFREHAELTYLDRD